VTSTRSCLEYTNKRNIHGPQAESNDAGNRGSSPIQLKRERAQFICTKMDKEEEYSFSDSDDSCSGCSVCLGGRGHNECKDKDKTEKTFYIDEAPMDLTMKNTYSEIPKLDVHTNDLALFQGLLGAHQQPLPPVRIVRSKGKPGAAELFNVASPPRFKTDDEDDGIQEC